ncbi:MAG TPA: hypothetical protein VD790_06875 [Thermoleophilaceae bacterium]|nr:hypothetical protein [Thermoleophilaceae bacterium]
MPRSTRLARWVVPLLLGVLCLLVYNANLRTIGAGDTLPNRYLPLIFWHDGTPSLDANARLVAHGHPIREPGKQRDASATYFEPSAFWMFRAPRGQLASVYPVVTPLLVAPLYLPVTLWLEADGWEQPQIDRVAEVMEKLSASLLAAIASVLMFLVLRREGNRWALPLALVFAFGTNTWMTSSQALWQHGSGQLLVALALLLAVSRASPARTGLLGFVCVLIAANRPPDVLIAGAFLAFAVWSRKRDAVWLLPGAALPLAALLYYNLGFIGHLGGGYAAFESSSGKFFDVDLLGLPGLLVSPTRGLLVFTPFLIFIGVGLAQRLRTPSSRQLAIALSAAVVAQLLLYSQADWRAGESWGPRWLADLLPIMVWMLAPAPLVLRPSARRVLVATMVVAVGVQAIGAFWYTKTSDERIFAGDPESMRGAWDPSNTPFLVELRHSPAPGELQCGARGFIERIGATRVHGDGAAALALEPGAALEGWALTCGRTPAQALVLIDGMVIGTTKAFTSRPDVDRAMDADSPSGWRVAADISGIAPGEHVLQLAVRVEPRSDIRVIREEPVTVASPPGPPASGTGLRALAANAAQRLRDNQSGKGYWLTTFTSSPRYEAPQEEMNTYLTSTLVDLLAPVARSRGLGDAVVRARRHLAAQIESDGLVRYHGLPDAPTIGTLGCVITPDSDDTALAWRLAGRGAGDPRLGPMLRTLARYRDGRGLYRTWLAPQERYECLDPGRDPNPADFVIQMHVYLMLRELDRPEARNLCDAIRRVAGEDDATTYYAKTPLMPYLRSAELRRHGCRIPLREVPLAQPAPGQEPWSELVRALVRASASRPDPEARRAIDDLLMRLGSDDFALLRQTPPLLYHNDQTATVSRFYWSEDAGYALWLRLYEAAR